MNNKNWITEAFCPNGVNHDWVICQLLLETLCWTLLRVLGRKFLTVSIGWDTLTVELRCRNNLEWLKKKNITKLYQQTTDMTGLSNSLSPPSTLGDRSNLILSGVTLFQTFKVYIVNILLCWLWHLYSISIERFLQKLLLIE